MKLFFEGDTVGYGVVVDNIEPPMVNPGDVARAKLKIIDDDVRDRVNARRPDFKIGDTAPRGVGRFL